MNDPLLTCHLFLAVATSFTPYINGIGLDARITGRLAPSSHINHGDSWTLSKAHTHLDDNRYRYESRVELGFYIGGEMLTNLSSMAEVLKQKARCDAEVELISW